MPQLFQILKCFKCSVFQVHPTKKSTKWECKMCGDKQSIKRHYGLGTGKECRLYVQRLNGIRGEVDDLNEIENNNERSDEEEIEKDIINVPKRINIVSKWSEFDDKTEHKEPECSGSMFLGNAEVVLDVPAKRRKCAKPITKTNANNLVNQNQTAVSNPIETDSDWFYNVKKPSTHLFTFSKSQTPNTLNNVPETSDFGYTPFTESEIKIEESKIQRSSKRFVPCKVEKNTKWAQFAEESDEDNNQYNTINVNDDNEEHNVIVDLDCNVGNNTAPNNDANLRTCEIGNITKARNLFSLCDENDLDDVLDI